MKFYGDYHVHSQNSDGRQDEKDIIDAASRKGLKEVAITDHGPLAAVIGIKGAEEYRKIRARVQNLNEINSAVTVLIGAEANIRDLSGTLDIPAEIIQELDILIAGLHPYTLPTSIKDGYRLFAQNSLRHLGKGQKQKAINNNTKASIEAIYANPRLDILSHPGLFFSIEVQEVAIACAKREVLFEINCGHRYPDISDIMEAERAGADFIINSDAHFRESVGDLEYGRKIVKKLTIDRERIANQIGGGGYKRWAKKEKNCGY